MKIPVIVGIILALIFVVSFTGWFYNVISGAKQLVLDDEYFGWRIAWTSFISIAFMVAVFFGLIALGNG